MPPATFTSRTDNCRILKVTPSGSITTTTTVTGSDSGACGFSGDGGPPPARCWITFRRGADAAGTLHADTYNQRIRRVSAATGTIATLAGSRFSGYTGDGGPSASARCRSRCRIGDPHGNIYVSDTQNNVIRLMTRTGPPSRSDYLHGFGGFTSIAPGPSSRSTDRAWRPIRWIGSNAFNGVNAPTSLAGTKVTIGGQAAFIAYAGPGQVNALVPSNVATGQQQITVTTAIGTALRIPSRERDRGGDC